MTDTKHEIVRLARLMYTQGLTDTAGGNISARVEGRIYVSPRYMGSRYQFEIITEQISVLDAATHAVLEGPPDLSREIRMHLAAYDRFPEVGAVIHAHPHLLQVFGVAGRAMPPVLEYTAKFGTVECIAETPSHSQDLANRVVELAARRADQLKRTALAVILPKHGVAVLAPDLNTAYDALERLEENARCILFARLLPPEA
jgi:L-fuculose-phosphate aldolase